MKIERATRSYSFLCFCLYLEINLSAAKANDLQNYGPLLYNIYSISSGWSELIGLKNA
jgi:hypothetical protein